MKSFFFGRSEQPLYGVYHPPLAQSAQAVKDEGVLLCNPYGQEYMRAHRAFRQVATLLNRLGYPVMRFDYFGTGDSAGKGEAATAEQWLQDIELAMDELSSLANVSRVSLVGLRLGATLAGWLSTQREDIERVVMWDPLLGGEEYIHEMVAFLKSRRRDSTVDQTYQDGFYMNGFPLTSMLQASLCAIQLEKRETYSNAKYLLVTSREDESFRRLHNHFEAHCSDYEYQQVPSPGNWNFVDNFGGVLIPHAIIQAIVKWF